MTIQEATYLIEPAAIATVFPQYWADLGCGDGTFTRALANLLPFGSSITAVDSSPQILDSVMGNHITIRFQKLNFDREDFRLANLDGILMANSFHYIRKKELLVKRLEQSFKSQKRFVMIEYESSMPSPWVPYPISFNKLHDLFEELGYEVAKINERKSRYGGKMYAALITSKA